VFVDATDGLSGLRIDRDGGAVDAAPFSFEDGQSGKSEPAVDCGGGTCLVAYLDDRHGRIEPYFQRVSGATLLDDGGVTGFTGANGQREASVAWSGTNYLVAWEDDRSGDPDVYGLMLDGTGTPFG